MSEIKFIYNKGQMVHTKMSAVKTAAAKSLSVFNLAMAPLITHEFDYLFIKCIVCEDKGDKMPFLHQKYP